MITTLLIPGLNGSTDDHWQRHWARDDPQAVVVEQDDWACPVLGDWQQRLDEALSKTDGALLVAHSLGCLLAASYAARPAGKIKGALLVAPCSLEAVQRLHPCMVRFGDEPLDRLPFPNLVIGSLDDPYMSIEQLERHVASWDSELTTIGFAGHINVASGFGPWPQGRHFLDRLLRRASPSLPAPLALPHTMLKSVAGSQHSAI
ncbi:RBBP9/YdeN family alpha/beta hydrolase [Neorhizobium lilium]|nr:alpha/beta hydrolase [Neorhizobium lilium]